MAIKQVSPNSQENESGGKDAKKATSVTPVGAIYGGGTDQKDNLATASEMTSPVSSKASLQTTKPIPSTQGFKEKEKLHMNGETVKEDGLVPHSDGAYRKTEI